MDNRTYDRKMNTGKIWNRNEEYTLEANGK
jgi:hypothetical protein